MDQQFPDLPNTKMSAYEKRISYGTKPFMNSRETDNISKILNPVADVIDENYSDRNRKLIRLAEERSKNKQVEQEQKIVDMEDTRKFRLKRFQDVPSRVVQRVHEEKLAFHNREKLLKQGHSEEEVYSDSENVHLEFLRKGHRDNVPINTNVHETKPLPRNQIKDILPDFVELSEEAPPESGVDWETVNKRYPRKLNKKRTTQTKIQEKKKKQVSKKRSEDGLEITHKLGQIPQYLSKMQKQQRKKQFEETESARKNKIVMVPMPEQDRLQILREFKTERDEKISKLYKLPMSKSTISVEKYRSELEIEIRELGKKIDEMNKPPVFITLYRGEYENRLSELGLKAVDMEGADSDVE